MKEKVRSFLENFLENEIGIEREVILEENYLRSDMGLDSTEVVDVALALKKEYGVELDLKDDKKLSEIIECIVKESYESVNIIEKDTDYVKFELVTVADKEGQIKRWTSERFTDSANMQVKANRLNPLFPFEYMKIYWTYEILPNDCGVFLTWRQRFVLDKKCPYSLCEMESYLNRTSIHELERIRERMEKILNEK